MSDPEQTVRKDKQSRPPIALFALVLAWLIPGAGHFYLKRYARGIIIFVTLSAIFWSGMAMGGVLTVDLINARWWFVADMLTGVHGLTGWYLQQRVYNDIPGAKTMNLDELDKQLTIKGVALNSSPVDNVARAYAGVAGMLNLLCMADALLLAMMGVSGESRPLRERRKTQEAA